MSFPRILSITLILAAAFIGCGRDPDTQKRHFLDLGNKYYDQEDYTEASIFYRKALQYDGRYAEAYYRLGLTALKLGQGNAAAAAFQRASELDPANSDAFVQLADLYLQSLSGPIRRNQEATLSGLIQLTERAERERPGSYDVLYVNGAILYIQKDYKGAIQRLEEALVLKPMDPKATLALAMAHHASGDAETAESTVRSYLEASESQEYRAQLLQFLYRLYASQGRLPEAEEALRSTCDSFPESQGNWLRLASFYHVTNRPKEADKIIAELLDRFKDDSSAYMHVGDFYVLTNQPNRAVEYLRQGSELDPKQEKTFRVRLASAYSAAGEIEKAHLELEAVLEDEPENPEALGVRGLLRLNSGDVNLRGAALEDLKTAISKLPNNYRLRFQYGRALAGSGDPLQAETQFEESLRLNPDYSPAYYGLVNLYLNNSEYPRAKTMAEQVLRAQPLDPTMRIAMAVAHMGLRENKEARAILEDLFEKRQRAADAIYYLAVLDASEGNFKDAERRFRALTEATPPDPRGIGGLVKVLVSQRRFSDALSHLEEALAREPGRRDLKFGAARVSMAAEDYDQASEFLIKILQDEPKNSFAHVLLARMMAIQGDREGARRHLRDAVDGTPPLADAFFEYGAMLAMDGNYTEARKHFERCLEIQPGHERALNNLAYVLAEMDQNLDLAVTYAQRAVARDPKNPDFNDTLAYVYIKRRLFDDAVNLLTPLVRDRPDRADFHYHLGLAHFQNGDKEQARQALQAIDQDGLNPVLADQVRRLISQIGG